MAETQSFGRRTAAAKAKQKKGEPKKEVNWVKLIAAALVGIVIWFIPAPAGLEAQAWHMFAIFRSEERRVGKECRSRWSPYH